jgi:uncharacterized oligopeptide transporter (OPT) family protein
MTVATLLLTCLIFFLLHWTGENYYVTALSVGAIVCVAASNGGTTSQDLKTGFLVGATPKLQQIAILIGAFGSALILGPILIGLNNANTVYVPVKEVTAELRTDPASLTTSETLGGPQAREDSKSYRVWHKKDKHTGFTQKYLVDEKGNAVYRVDPGINGTEEKRPDGSTVQKFDNPKATLMAYIIKGVLGQEIPWALVLLGVMIAVVLELCGISSLPFAVGVYLPISSSMPIFIGGLIRYLVDSQRNREPKYANLTPEQLAAEGDKSPGARVPESQRPARRAEKGEGY